MEISRFLQDAYTAYHATALSCKELEQEGFVRLERGERWDVKAGGKYYVVANGSAFVAFRVGDPKGGFSIACAHTDSPCLKVKGAALADSPEGKRINVEVYGGLLLYSMLDIPLKVAGRVLVKTEGGVESKLVVSDYTVNIPSMCIHHNPDANKDLCLNPQVDMLPLLCEAEDVYSSLGLKDVLDADLYVVPAVAPYRSGSQGELLVSPRIDNLTSVYACVEGIAKADPKGIAVVACFDNEEIGSGTKQGAGSVLLEEVLRHINLALGGDEVDFGRRCRDGLLLSIDNGHAVHPAHPEKSDILQKVYMGGGVVVKHHTNYATDGRSAAVFKAVMDDEGVPYQDYYNRSDLRCGSTLGLISSRQLAMDAVDIGLAQLAMHSAQETAAYADVAKMEQAVRACLSRGFVAHGEQVTIQK